MPRPTGSPLEESLLEHLEAHLANEREVLAAYVDLAESAPDEWVRYLAALIVDDERRHHQRFVELRNRILSDVTWADTRPQTPQVTVAKERDALLREVSRAIDVERRDAVDLRRLRRLVAPMKDTSLLALMIEVMELDTQKHVKILEFIRRAAR